MGISVISKVGDQDGVAVGICVDTILGAIVGASVGASDRMVVG